VPLGIETLQRGVRAVDEGDNDLSLAGSPGAFDQHVIAVDDVLVAHGIAADFEGEHVAVADNVVKGNCFWILHGFNGHAGCDSACEQESVTGAIAGSGRQDVDGPASIVDPIEEALLFKVGNVLVHGGQAFQPHSPGDLFERGGIAVAQHERTQKIDYFFLPSCDSHGRIIAKKKRIARRSFCLSFSWNSRRYLPERRPGTRHRSGLLKYG
jgi:hypothetical protein